MPQATLDYLNSSPEAYLDCREGRHDYPRLRPHQMRFARTPDGYDVCIVECRCCHVAFSQELWLIREDAEGKVIDMRRVQRTTKYRRLEENEPAYLMEPGSGGLNATDLREMRVASHFVGGSVRRTGGRAESA